VARYTQELVRQWQDGELKPPVALPVESLMTAEEIGFAFNIDRSSVFRMARTEPDFPRPLHLSRKAPRWRATEVNAWLAARAAARK
jgi:predicted DNA-binding transcriptional regulator AlpA